MNIERYRVESLEQIWAVTDDGKLVKENWEKEELACVQHVDHRVVAWTCPSPSARVSCQEVEQQQQADSTKHQKIGHMNDSGAHLQCEDRILPHYLLLVDSICIWVCYFMLQHYKHRRCSWMTIDL